MKLLYKTFIVIILFGSHFEPVIANKIQPHSPTRIADVSKYKKNHFHSYMEINAITQKNLNHAKEMLQTNLDFAKDALNKNLVFANDTIDKTLRFAELALQNGNNPTNNEQSLKSNMDLSNAITYKTLETITNNIDKSLATTEIGIKESFQATNASLQKSLGTYTTLFHHNGANSTMPTDRHHSNIKPKMYNSGSSAHNSNTDIKNDDEDFAHLNRN